MRGEQTMKKNRPILFGIFGGTALFLIYFVILTFANSLDHAIEQFFQIWYWILILALGFGIQVGLYYYIKYSKNMKIEGGASEMAASGGVSTLSMIACCSHHLVDILPIIGLSVASAFLVKYQISFILIGVFSNLIAIQTMLGIIQIHHLYKESGIFNRLFFFNIKKIRLITIALTILTITISFITNIIL
jgi:hypothetical protein